MILGIIIIGIFIFVIWLTLDRRSKVLKGQVNNNPLNRKEKLFIWTICFLNPIWGGAILYYGWRKILPEKAKQANTISFGAFGILIILEIIYVLLGGDPEKII